MRQTSTPPSLAEPLVQYIQLHDQVRRVLDQSRRDFQKQLSYPRTVAKIHYSLIALGGYFLGLALLTSPLRTTLEQQVIIAIAPGLAAVIAVIFLTLVLVIPCILPYSIIKYFSIGERWRPLILFLFILLIYPLLLATAASLPGLIQGVFIIRNFSSLAFLGILGSFFLLGFFWPILFMLSGLFPEILFLLWTSVRTGATSSIVPSYETLLQKISQSPEVSLATYSELELEQFEAIAQRKQTGINGRLQSLSMAAGSVALLGLLASIVASDQIADALNSALIWFADILGIQNHSATTSFTGVQSIVFLLMIVVLLALYYFSSTYRELRILEIICILCGFRLAHSTSVDVSPIVVPSIAPLRESNWQPLRTILISGATLLIVLIYRELRRLTRW